MSSPPPSPIPESPDFVPEPERVALLGSGADKVRTAATVHKWAVIGIAAD